MGRACSTHREKWHTYEILVGKLERKRQLGRARCMWEDNIKICVREIGCGDMGWIRLAQNRNPRKAFVNTVMYVRVP
jgi:hypothetical protein